MKVSTIVPLTVGLALPRYASALTVFSFDSSSAAGWTVTGGGAVNATPYVVTIFGNYSPVLSVATTGNAAGTFLPGGSAANFDGFWIADYTFSLPANAVNVQFDYTKFFADGRGVLKLNGTIINSAGFPGVGGSLDGFMIFTAGGQPQPYTFNGPFGNVSGSATSGFNIGGVNTIEVIMNNTAVSVASPMVGLPDLDGTGLGIVGTISYAVPEPSFATLALAALGGAFLRIHRTTATK